MLNFLGLGRAANIFVMLAIALTAMCATANAQYPWTAVHPVTGTTSTAVSIIGKATNADYSIRVTSIVVCGSQAGTFTLSVGGTAPTTTLSTTYPWYTIPAHANLFPAYSDWPLSFYTASNASGGKTISTVTLPAAGCTGFNGLSVDRKYFTVAIQKKTTQFYTVTAALTVSGDVSFAANGEVVK